MTDYGVTDAGFVLKPLAAILEELASRQRADIDSQWNTEPDSLAGQLNGIFGDALAQGWEVLEEVFYALSREADGQALDIVGALTVTPRRAATKSSVALRLNLNAGVTVPTGSIVSVTDNPEIRVVTLDDVTNAGGAPANVSVAAEAESAGAITANAGTLEVIETPVSGWNSVTNLAALSGGLEIETDPQYRLRQVQQLSATGSTSAAGLRTDLQRVAGVTDAYVIDNDSDEVVDGVPAKSIEAIVQGGDDLEIAQALFASKAAGIYTHGGDGPFTVTDEQGIEHAVRFTRPTVVAVYVALDLVVGDGYAGDAAVRTAINAASLDSANPSYQRIGGSVYAGRIIATAMQVSGVLNATAGLSMAPIATAGSGASEVAIDPREVAVIDAASVAVNS